MPLISGDPSITHIVEAVSIVLCDSIMRLVGARRRTGRGIVCY